MEKSTKEEEAEASDYNPSLDYGASDGSRALSNESKKNENESEHGYVIEEVEEESDDEGVKTITKKPIKKSVIKEKWTNSNSTSNEEESSSSSSSSSPNEEESKQNENETDSSGSEITSEDDVSKEEVKEQGKEEKSNGEDAKEEAKEVVAKEEGKEEVKEQEKKETKGEVEQEKKNARKVDRYGWYLEDKEISKTEQKLIQIENSKEYERSIKWNQMLDSWDFWMPAKEKKVGERIRKGIPDAMRNKAWRKITYADNYITEKKMEELLQMEPHPMYAVIDKDLKRTFPQIGFFSQPNFIESLRRILYCYCQVDPELGYTQGMSFIAGMFLAYMDEETAFYSFISVMKSDKINQREYLIAGFPRLTITNKMLSELMKQKFLNVYKNFENNGVDLLMFTTNWFLTAYQSFNWAPEFQLRIFERFLFFGTRVLLSFALLIIELNQEELATASLEKILQILQHIDESKKMVDWHRILNKLDKRMIPKQKYIELVKNAGGKPEPLI